MIRTSIKNAILDSPLVLINALSGRLCDKSEQAAAFELTPAFITLITSMTTHIDRARIEQVVREFYRYATFSHTWQSNEPLHEKVTRIVVYDLKASPTHEKLRMFCKIVRDEGFIWAWSDTCCIDQKDPSVLQESLVSMFKWYEGSVMTIIFLYDVDRLEELGALTRSRWNSRGWTLQEYHASNVVRIYTKEWTPYLGLTIHNHKESPEIISEMEKATGISAEALRMLRPGLNNIREKLRLASTRQTTRVEDAAYSLLGIFLMTLRVTYGEGDKALGRLLAELLTSSGDTSILAWQGRSGSFNSCLPTNIIVFNQPWSSHIPPTIPDAKMATIAAGLRASSLDLNLVTRLYNRVNELRTPRFAGQRMTLQCLAFKIRTISLSRNEPDVFRAQAGALGVVEIKTMQNIALLDSLYLVHPWIDFLLDRRAVGNIVDTRAEENESSNLDEFFDALSDLSATSDADPLDSTSFPSSSTAVALMNAQMEFLARLRQPFGALLLAPTRRNVAEYKRIATENPISVQVQEITSATLNELIQGVRVLDVL